MPRRKTTCLNSFLQSQAGILVGEVLDLARILGPAVLVEVGVVGLVSTPSTNVLDEVLEVLLGAEVGGDLVLANLLHVHT